MKPKSIWPQSTTRKQIAWSVLIWRITSLPFYYSVLAEHFEGIIKKIFRLKCCTGLIKPSKRNTANWEQRGRAKNERQSEEWFFITMILTTNNTSVLQICQDDSRCTAYKKLKPGLYQIFSRNNRITYLQSCSKEGFKAVNISVANVSCEIWIPAIITTMWRPRYIRGKLEKRVRKHVLAILTNLFGDQALKRRTRRLQQFKK